MLLPQANPAAERESFRSAIQEPPMAWAAPTLLRFWHLCSLDAPTVAVVWSLSFAWAAGVRLPLWAPVLLALGTWVVYVGDRLLDTHKALDIGTESSLRDRHFFHWRHRRTFVPLALIATVAGLGIILTCMPTGFRERNSLLAFAALAYFSGVHRPPGLRLPRVTLVSKEFLVGILFTAGCALPVLTRIPHRLIPSTPLIAMLPAAVFFAGLAWLNCAAIERWETGNACGIAWIGCALGSAGIPAAILLRFVDLRVAMLILTGSLSALLLVLLDKRRERMTPLALRTYADVVLLIPLVLWVR
jgi:hypothetical protein